MDKTLQQIVKLAKKNQENAIYEKLNDFQGSTKQKGDLFEYFLAELYKGIGCKVEVVGGANDGGVDLVIYYGNSPSKVYAIVQAKNVKTRLTKKDLQSEYAKLVGDNISSQQASAKTYKCTNIFIISLNAYVKNAYNLTTPKKYKVHLYDRFYVKKLIEDYSNKSQKKCPFQLKRNKIYYVISLILISVAVASWYFYKDNVEEYNTLTNEMLARLNNTQLGSYVKQDCKNFNYPLNTCREKLVYRYMKKYDSLEKGLMVYFCGETHFKRGSCSKNGKKLASFVLHGR